MIEVLGGSTPFAGRLGEWLGGNGQDHDIVISTRIRLARNLAPWPFTTMASPAQRAEVAEAVRAGVEKMVALDMSKRSDEAPAQLSLVYCDLSEASARLRQCLVERHLISKDLAATPTNRAVAYSDGEAVSIMVNEEDHLRIQVLRAGFEPQTAWDQAQELDNKLEQVVDYAFSPEFGFLTACPTNCGTGMRVSVMLHLPALVMTKQIDRVFQAVSKINLAVRGLYGEGTQASGDFYQISNQVTLGRSELDILRQLVEVVPQITHYERAVRETLLTDNRTTIEDRVWRAYGTLRAVRTVTSEETMDLLSAVRMGVNIGLLAGVDIDTVNRLFIYSQPAHLQQLEGRSLDTRERDEARAHMIRTTLGSLE